MVRRPKFSNIGEWHCIFRNLQSNQFNMSSLLSCVKAGLHLSKQQMAVKHMLRILSVCRAVGCIFGELLNNSPLFPGENDIEQLCCVLRVLGTPNQRVWPVRIVFLEKRNNADTTKHEPSF